MPNAAIASHLIPRHLLNVFPPLEIILACNHRRSRVSERAITRLLIRSIDPFDPRVGVLLVPDLDHHVDSFQAGFYVAASTIVSYVLNVVGKGNGVSYIQK